MITILLLIVHVLAAAGVIGLVLLQHGKGADMGAAFGGGSSGSLFGASGSANFLSRSTGVLAAVFFLTSLGLTVFHGRTQQAASVMDAPSAEQRTVPEQVPQPAVPAPAPTSGESQAPAGSK